MARAIALAPYRGTINRHVTEYVDRVWRRFVPEARDALQALKYEDGTDESRLIDVAARYQTDPVCVAETWDAMIDAILAEPTNA